MRLSKFGWVLLGLVLVPAILIALILVYIQSSSFRDQLVSIASDTMDSSVELGNDVHIAGLFPRVVLELDTVLIKSLETDSDMWRARLQNLQVSISPSLLVSRGTSGELNVKIDRASVIAELPDDEVQASRTVDIDALRAGVAPLVSSVKELLKLSVSLTINHVNVITRDPGKRSAKYVAKEVLVKSSDTRASATARIVWSDFAEQQIHAQLSELNTTATDETAVLSGQLDVEVLPSVGVHSAAELTADISLVDDTLDISQLETKTDWMLLRADTSMDWSSTDLQFQSDIETRFLELSALMSDDAEREPVGKVKRLFPYDVFKQSLPLNVAGDIDLHLGAVRLNAMPLINGTLDIALADGVLQVTGDDLRIMGGSSTLAVEVDNTLAQLVAFKSKLEVDELQLSRIRLGENTESVISQGNADLIISLKGQGPSPGHIAASLDGYVLAGMSDTKITKKYSTLIDRGIVSWALHKAKQWSGNNTGEGAVNSRLSDPLHMDCISLRVYINDGRAEVSNGAIINFPDNTLFSSGYIDLASEQLGFAFRTRSKSLFDWSAISIVKYAELSGTLVEPNVALNTKELAKQGIKSASSVAWGPLPAFVYSLAEAGVKNASNGSCKPSIW